MSADHLPPRTLRDYRHGRLGPAETLAASDHLVACPACRAALADLDDNLHHPEGTDAPRDPGGPADLRQSHREPTAPSDQVPGPAGHNGHGGKEDVFPELSAASSGEVVVLTSPAGTWWHRHEALVLTLASIVAVLLLTTVWWWVAGSKPAAENALLSDARGRPADLTALPPEMRDAVSRTLREGHVPIAPPPPGLHSPMGALAGPAPAAAAATFYVVEPVGVTVRKRRPTFRWTTRADATGYVVLLEPLGQPPGTPAPPPVKLPATQTEWTPPGPLTAGTTYAWQVEARRGTDPLDHAPRPPAAEARFQVLDEARAAELDRLERQFNAFPLVMAVALARAGLADEAAGQLGKLAREHPQSDAAQRLWRGATAVAENYSGRREP